MDSGFFAQCYSVDNKNKQINKTNNNLLMIPNDPAFRISFVTVSVSLYEHMK